MERFARATAVAAALAAAFVVAPARGADASLSASIGDAGAEVVFRALSLLGVDYRWGGNSPETGLDCSGLVRLVYADALGLPLPRRSEEISRVGPAIAPTELQPGDLVFFNTLRRAFSHVGIYIGNNQFVHAPSTGGSIRVESLDAQYWSRRFDGARRLLTQDLLAAASMNPLSASAARAMQASNTRGARPAAASAASGAAPGPAATPIEATTLAGLGAPTPTVVWAATDGVPAGFAAPSPGARLVPAPAAAPPAAPIAIPPAPTVIAQAANGPLATVESRATAASASPAPAPAVPPSAISRSPASAAADARVPAARGPAPRTVRASASAPRPAAGARTAAKPARTAAPPARAKTGSRADAKGADRRLAARADGLFVN